MLPHGVLSPALEQPEHGKLEINQKGKLKMTADKGEDAVGPDWALIEVDDGTTAVEVDVDIEILERTCGCAAGSSRSAGLGLALLGLVGLARRRRD